MSMTWEGIKVFDLYTTDGRDLWEVESYCEHPTVSLVNIRSGERLHGAVGCPLFKDFKRLVVENTEGGK